MGFAIAILANIPDTSNRIIDSIGVTAAATIFSLYIQAKYLNLAEDYYDLYKDQRDFYYNNFQGQGELPFTNEQFGVAPYNPDYIGVFHVGILPPGALYLFNPLIALRRSFVSPSWTRKARMYNSQLEVSGSYAADTAAIADDWYSYMFRYEEHKRDVFNERRWANQMDALSYGVKEAANVERGLATSFAVFDEAQGQVVSEINSVGNGLSTYLQRKDTLSKLLSEPKSQLVSDRIFQSGMEN